MNKAELWAQTIADLVEQGEFTMEDFISELEEFACLYCGRFYTETRNRCYCRNDE
jgi:hypothetical protein